MKANFKQTETPPPRLAGQAAGQVEDGSTLLTTGIPEGWETFRLGDVCQKIGSGATPRGGSGVYIPKGISLIRSQNVYNNRFERDGLAFIEDEHAGQLENVTVEKEDVLLNITGDSVARVCQVPDDILPARVNQHVAIVRARRDKLDPTYLRYYLTSPRMQSYMLGLAAVGATRNALTKGMIESFEILAPAITEQRVIAKILSDLDEKIELNHQMNKTLEAIGQALFKRWFVDFEFPGYEKTKFVNGLPEGWQNAKFGAVVSCVKTQVRPGGHLSNRRYVPIECMSMKQLWLSDYKNYTEAQSSLITFEKGDILFGAMRAYFHRVNYAPFAGITRTTVFVLRPHKADWLEYALLLMNLDESVEYANAHSKGSTMPYAVWENSLERMPIVLPSEGLIAEFSKTINPYLELINANAEMNQRLTQIRDSLLPKMMSGKIRVGNIP